MKDKNNNKVLAERAIINIDIYSILINELNHKERYKVIYINQEKLEAVLLSLDSNSHWETIDLTNTNMIIAP